MLGDGMADNEIAVLGKKTPLEAADKRIEELEAQMPKRGEWIRHGTDEDEFCYYECPLCGFIGIDWNYCPNCGARMDGKEHNDEQADC
jgi:rubrerythrin